MQIPSLVHEVFERYLTSSCVSNNIYQSFCQLLSKEDTSIVYLEYINLSHHCSRVGGRQVFQHILYMCTLEICPSTLPQIRVQVQRLHQNSSPSPNSWDKVKSVLNLSEKFKSVLKYLLKHTPPPPHWGGGGGGLTFDIWLFPAVDITHPQLIGNPKATSLLDTSVGMLVRQWELNTFIKLNYTLNSMAARVLSTVLLSGEPSVLLSGKPSVSDLVCRISRMMSFCFCTVISFL